MAQPKKILDLDAELDFTVDPEAPLHTTPVRLLGMDVRVVADLNSFGLMAATNSNTTAAELMSFLESMIHPEDWPSFGKAAATHPKFRGTNGSDNMMNMIRRIMEVAAAPFPTKQPSDLPVGGSARSRVQKSPGSTASKRAVRSTTSR